MNPNSRPSSGQTRRPKRSVLEKSCGVILYRQASPEREYLLLHYPGGHWDFPKGHVETRDSSEKATAQRELEEETGITSIVFDEVFRTSMYYEFNRGNKERVKKTVVYFVAESLAIAEHEVQLSHEHQNFEWLPYEAALERLTFENARGLLRQAEEHLIASL
jgi:bis(5'-nucleosidyl)-tetraphosphatase